MNYKNCILELIEQFSSPHNTGTAFELYDGHQIVHVPYQKFAKDILCSVRFFQDHQIENTHIALIGDNSYEWIVSFLAIAATGNAAVLINPLLPPDLVLRQCRMADVSLICCHDQHAANLADFFPCYPYSELLKNQLFPVSNLPRPHHTATVVMMFTSGTTGEGKIVELSYQNIASSIRSADQVFSEPGIEKIMSVLPMFHIAGLRGTLAMLYRNKTICIGRGAKYLFQDLPALSPSYVLLVPMIADSLVKLLQRTTTPQKYLGSSLKRICLGGAAPNPSVCRYMLDLGFTLDGGYAMTETSGVGTWGQWDDQHFNTIGKLSSELQCRIEDGELLFKGPSVMKGYYKDPDATAKVLKDGWFHSGDLGFCDEDGYYYITGRKKNVIVMSNGEKINPEETEHYLMTCDAILECIVTYRNGALCLDVYVKDTETAKAFLERYHANMPTAFHFQKISFLSEPFRKNSTGKIIREEPLS